MRTLWHTLTSLVGIFENLNLGKNRAENDDLLGDAYEYLMRHFATESGKSKGQFYTPSEVSRILSKILGISKATRQDEAVYDPTCGSGSLLLKVNDEAPNGLTLYGQEKDNATAALAKMNMILHDSPSAEIWQDDTLSEPHWLNKDGGLKTFDYAVANPPFSYKSWSSGINVAEDPFKRFEYGAPPEKNGDYAFLLHIIKSLKSTGSHRAGYSDALVKARDVKPTILEHTEFTAFKDKSLALFQAWKAQHAKQLSDLNVGDSPKELIFDISEDLLAKFADADLLSKYDIYQILMDYWAEIMQDDV